MGASRHTPAARRQPPGYSGWQRVGGGGYGMCGRRMRQKVTREESTDGFGGTLRASVRSRGCYRAMLRGMQPPHPPSPAAAHSVPHGTLPRGTQWGVQPTAARRWVRVECVCVAGGGGGRGSIRSGGRGGGGQAGLKALYTCTSWYAYVAMCRQFHKIIGMIHVCYHTIVCT